MDTLGNIVSTIADIHMIVTLRGSSSVNPTLIIKEFIDFQASAYSKKRSATVQNKPVKTYRLRWG